MLLFPANATRCFFAFHLREQPHGEHHHKPEKCDEILDAIVTERVLHVERYGRNESDHKRQN